MCLITRHNGQCRTQSLRLIGDGSPGSRDSQRPRHPRALDDEELFIVERSKNSTSGTCRQLRILQNTRGAYENCPKFHVKLLISNRSIYCAYFSSSQEESKMQNRLQDLSTAFMQNIHPLSSQACASRVGHGTCCCTTTGTSTPYQGTGPVQLHGRVHSVHCAAPTQTN